MNTQEALPTLEPLIMRTLSRCLNRQLQFPLCHLPGQIVKRLVVAELNGKLLEPVVFDESPDIFWSQRTTPSLRK